MATFTLRIFSPPSGRCIQHFITRQPRGPIHHFPCARLQLHNIKPRWQSTQSTSPKAQLPKPRRTAQAFRGADAPSSDQIRLENLFQKSDTVLLFRAGPRKVFTFCSIFLGGILIVGGGMTANVLSTLAANSGVERIPILLLVPQVVTVGFFIIMGVVIMWTPFRTLKSVTAVANRGGARNEVRPILQCQPFWPSKKFEIAPVDARIEERVAVIDTNDIFSIPLANSKKFTDAYLNTSNGSVGKTVSGMNKGLVDIWPAIKTSVKSMLLREGMLRVHLRGHGVWKLDLHGSQILDAGQPLKLLTTPDKNVGASLTHSLGQRVSKLFSR